MTTNNREDDTSTVRIAFTVPASAVRELEKNTGQRAQDFFKSNIKQLAQAYNIITIHELIQTNKSIHAQVSAERAQLNKIMSQLETQLRTTQQLADRNVELDQKIRQHQIDSAKLQQQFNELVKIINNGFLSIRQNAGYIEALNQLSSKIEELAKLVSKMQPDF